MRFAFVRRGFHRGREYTEQHQQLVRISRDLFAFFPKATHLSQPYVVLWNRRNGRGRVVILDVTRRQAVARSRFRRL